VHPRPRPHSNPYVHTLTDKELLHHTWSTPRHSTIVSDSVSIFAGACHYLLYSIPNSIVVVVVSFPPTYPSISPIQLLGPRVWSIHLLSPGQPTRQEEGQETHCHEVLPPQQEVHFGLEGLQEVTSSPRGPRA
jgi:hypothetical protein